jgi:hypothetical protein
MKKLLEYRVFVKVAKNGFQLGVEIFVPLGELNV